MGIERRNRRNKIRAKPVLSKLLINNRIDDSCNSTADLCNAGVVMRVKENFEKNRSFHSPVCW